MASEAVSDKSGEALSGRALHGTLWTGIRFAAEYALRLVSNLILTRLLVPEAFGLMALVSVLMTGLAMFSDMGISAAVVQNKRGDDPVFLNTAWTLQVIRGGVLWCFAALFADAMSLVYGKPELRALVLCAGLTAVIGGFNSISLLRLRRHLQIRKLAVIDTAAQFLTGAATITWAWFSPSVWALVWGGLLGSLAKMLISHGVLRDHRCRFVWDAEARRELFGFGKWIFLSTILFFLAGQADRLIFGRLLSVSMLGVFSIAAVLAAIPTTIVWQVGHSVVFPMLSRRSETEAGLRRVYRRSLQPLLVLGGLPVAGLAAFGPELIEILYDPRYADAGWMLQILALGAWFQVPQAASGAAVLALGRPRALAFANGTKFAAMILLLPLGFHVAGAAGAILGLAGAEFFRYAALALSVRRAGLPGIAADFSVTCLVVVAALAGIAVSQSLGEEGAGALARLAAAATAVTVVWVPAAAFLLREEIPGAWSGFRAWRARVARPRDAAGA